MGKSEPSGLPPVSSGEPTPEQKQKGILAEVLSAGFIFPLCVLIGYFLGSRVDRALGSSPFGTLIGVFLGFGAALIPVFRLSAAYERLEQKKKRQRAETDPVPQSQAPDRSGGDPESD